MPKIANTRKVFNFIIEIDGIDQFLVQKCTIPKKKLEVVEHGDTNHNVGTAGKVSFDNIVLEKLSRAVGSDTWAWDWMNECQDPETGGGSLPENYKRTIVIKQMAPNGTTTLNRWTCIGCFPIEDGDSDLDRMASDNTIETVTLWTDRVKKTA